MANQIRLKRASGSDPGASDLVTGELAVRTDTAKLFTKKDDNSVTEIGVTGNAATATKLETARTIAGVSFDGSANISLNNNAITNGAGYITATLTNEQVQDIVGGMLTGNTETGITVTYQDGDGTIDFVVGTLNQDTTGNAATATALETARTIAGVSFDGTSNISLNNNAITNGAGFITSSDSSITNKLPLAGGTLTGNLTLSSTHPKIILTDTNSDPDFQIINNHGNFLVYDSTNARSTFNIDGSGNIQVSGTVDGRDLATDGSKLDGIASGATNVTNTNQLTNGAGFITSADGGNAATLDSIDSSQFLRSDTGDTADGLLTINGGIAFASDTKCTAAFASLSDSSTILVNFASGIHHSVTLGGNRTLSHSNTSVAVGQSGSIIINQDGTGSRTLSFNSSYKFVGGTAPTLSTAANAKDRIDYVVVAANEIHAVISLDVK